MLSDPISDLLTRIRNAYAVKHKTVSAPYSKLKENLTKILKTNHYLKDYSIVGEKPHQTLQLVLSYPNKKPAAKTLIRVSKPGVRIYADHDKLNRYLTGLGITIISTSKGMMTVKQAKKLKIGGEIICKIK